MIQKDDIELRPILVWMTILTVTAVLSMVLCVALIRGFAWGKHRFVDPPLSPMAEPNTLPPEPRLQADPTLDWVQFRDQEEKLLNTYGWIDEPAGVVRLPIDRAIELTAKELR